MPLVPVHFEYLTGLRRTALANARLTGSWDAPGPPCRSMVDHGDGSVHRRRRLSGPPHHRAVRRRLHRSHVPMERDRRHAGQANVSGIPTEVSRADATDRTRSFTLARNGQSERYYLTHCRRLGANKLFTGGAAAPAIRFAVWAPNAKNVELVRSKLSGDNNSLGGYIWDDNRGVSATIPMHDEGDGVWSTNTADSPDLAQFGPWGHTLYMFRITKDNGKVAYRGDLYSRCQVGSGGVDPAKDPKWSGRRQDLDGPEGCSVVISGGRHTGASSDGGKNC